MPESRELHVLLDESHVGVLRYELEAVRFRPSDEYIALPHRPVLGQVFEDDLEREHRVRSGLPPWFANLLPEGPLRTLVAGAAGVHPTRDFFLLAHLGEDLPGAVRVVPDDPTLLVAAQQESGRDEVLEELAQSEFDFKFSLAGVQLKFSVLTEDRGVTIPVSGRHGNSIVKLPDERHDGVPENEFSMMTWASAAGIEVPSFRLLDTSMIDGLPTELADKSTQSFLITRFDRTTGGRIHIEDFAQVLNRPPTPEGKYGGANYETVARILYELGGIEDLKEMVRRLVAIVAMGNGDAHLKNWSLIYHDDITAHLSPAYDLVSTVTYVRGEETLALNLGGSRSFNDVGLHTFRRMARKLELASETDLDEVVIEAVERLQTSWRDLRDALPTKGAVKTAIDLRLSELPLMQMRR